MSEESTAVGNVVTGEVMDRNALRGKLLGDRHLAEREPITIFGVDIELRQPSFGSILDARDEASEKQRIADMIVKYAYVPGTDEQLFEVTDIDTILNWPFGDDLLRLNTAIIKLTGIELVDAEGVLEKSPLDEQ